MKTKELYTAPEMESIELRLEKCIMDVSNGVNWGTKQGNPGGIDYYDDSDNF